MLVVFDIGDDMQIPTEALEDIITKTPLWSLCTEWRWFDNAHLEHVIIAVPEPEGPTSDDSAQPRPDSDGSTEETGS